MSENGILSRPMSASLVQTLELVMPNDTNPHGTLSGGRLMHWIDLAGAMSAMRHARRMVVTAEIDDVVFHAPILAGHMVLLDAVVTCVGRTSMEVRVDVRGENPVTGEGAHTTTARLVFVALEDGVPIAVPAVVPETDDEKALHERDLHRRRQRTKERAC